MPTVEDVSEIKFAQAKRPPARKAALFGQGSVRFFYAMSRCWIILSLLTSTVVFLLNPSYPAFSQETRSLHERPLHAYAEKHNQTEKIAVVNGSSNSNKTLLNAFIDAAYSINIHTPNRSTEAPLILPDDLPGIENYLRPSFDRPHVKANYPWLYEFLYRDEGLPRFFALNKWTGPVLISTGFPNDLRPVFRSKTSAMPENLDEPMSHGIFPAAEEIVKNEVERVAPGLSRAANIPISFIPHREETSPYFANVRIVLFSGVNGWQTNFKRGVRWTQIANNGGLKPLLFRSDLEDALITAVHFTPLNYGQVDGFFLSNAQNEIGLAFCFIWQGHEVEMLKGLVRECVLRSLGLPDITEKQSLPSVLSEWNVSDPSLTVQPSVMPPEVSPFDLLLVQTLYSSKLKAGLPHTDTIRIISSNPD